jgi:hypothetical protein
MPTTGRLWQSDQVRYPRSGWWDLLTDVGCRTVHFEDFESLRRFPCPDASHLNCDDARLFSAALCEPIRDFRRKRKLAGAMRDPSVYGARGLARSASSEPAGP